jgi:hypothetical protein
VLRELVVRTNFAPDADSDLGSAEMEATAGPGQEAHSDNRDMAAMADHSEHTGQFRSARVLEPEIASSQKN